ncbi:hypothetical protein BVX98_05570 [bacterium F11]|nr:hypothetical protein BVX98_05570 [bacterium F11]
MKPIAKKTSLSFPKSRSLVEYHPLGTVLVVSPWNFPFQLSLVPICTALLAGNVVLLKASETTLAIGELIQSLLAQAGLPENVFTALPGDGKIGQKMIEEKPDLIFVTGSSATGQKIMEQASKNLIPVHLELGGKDPMLVFEDTPFERAVNAAVYGAFANAGQICVSVERLYVHENIEDKFTKAILHKTSQVRMGLSNDSDVGMMTTKRQVDVIKKQIEDAEKKGAVLLTPLRFEGNWVSPIVINKVTHDMLLMREETFGPVLPIMSFSSEEEAIKLANDSPFGLNASVWTKDLKKGRRIASQIQAGNCAVNDVVKNIGNPHLPFGGIKRSGFGRYHGKEGLRAFSRSMSIMINKGTAKRELNWFPYSSKLYKDLKIYLQFSYLKKNSLAALRNIWGTMKAYRKGQDD